MKSLILSIVLTAVPAFSYADWPSLNQQLNSTATGVQTKIPPVKTKGLTCSLVYQDKTTNGFGKTLETFNVSREEIAALSPLSLMMYSKDGVMAKVSGAPSNLGSNLTLSMSLEISIPSASANSSYSALVDYPQFAQPLSLSSDGVLYSIVCGAIL